MRHDSQAGGIGVVVPHFPEPHQGGQLFLYARQLTKHTLKGGSQAEAYSPEQSGVLGNEGDYGLSEVFGHVFCLVGAHLALMGAG